MVGHQFSGDQRSFMVLSYNRSRSPTETRARFMRQFPGIRPPNRTTVLRNFLKYRSFATSLNRNRGNSGRPRSGRPQRNIAAVRQELNRNPTATIRRNNVPQVSRSTFNRIVNLDLRWHPYKLIHRHALERGDYQRRSDFCHWLLQRPRRFLGELLIGDEATFHVNGKVSTHNVRCYAPKNHPPDFNYDVPLDRSKLNVWIGLMGNGRIYRPVFFDGNVNGRSYLQMINDEVVPGLQQHVQLQQNGAFPRLWWSQDGAPAHRTRLVRDRLEQLFPRHE